MNIKLGTKKDLNDIAELTKKSLHSQSGFFGYLERRDYRLESVKETISQGLEGGKIYFLAYENKKPIGIVSIELIEQASCKIEKMAKLSTMYVEEAYRGKGVATKLVEKAENRLKENDISVVDANIFIENEAGQRFWSKLGYKTCVTIKTKVIKDYK